MYIFLIQRTENEGYDEHYGFVVCALTHFSARCLARDHIGGSEEWMTDSSRSSCVRVGTAFIGRKPGVLLASFQAG